MISITAEKAHLVYNPVAVLWSDEKPEGALRKKTRGNNLYYAVFCPGRPEERLRSSTVIRLVARVPGRPRVWERVS